MKNKNGFTLTEVLVVVVVLAVLAAAVMPRFTSQTEKSYVMEAVGVLSAIRQLQEEYKLENGTYCDPDSSCNSGWTGLGMSDPDNNYWSYSVTAASATFTATASRSILNGGDTSHNVTLDQTGALSGSHPDVPA